MFNRFLIRLGERDILGANSINRNQRRHILCRFLFLAKGSPQVFNQNLPLLRLVLRHFEKLGRVPLQREQRFFHLTIDIPGIGHIMHLLIDNLSSRRHLGLQIFLLDYCIDGGLNNSLIRFLRERLIIVMWSLSPRIMCV